LDFSVLISLYDGEKPENLRLSLESVFSQTLLPSEVILVLDGPVRKELHDVLNGFRMKYHYLKVVSLKRNVGLGLALNHGLSCCSTGIVVRMDTDDINYPDRFEKQISFLSLNPEISIAGSATQEFRNTPGDLNRYRELPSVWEKIQTFARYRNPLNHPTVIFKKSAIESVGSYQDMPLFEDYFLWMRLILGGFKIANVTEPLLHFRIGNDMIGRRHGFRYLKKEYNFLIMANKLKFINNFQLVISLILKLPLRVIPKKMLELIYNVCLR
jgi:glycosyltransferase involved in cell wall biosynthesis